MAYHQNRSKEILDGSRRYNSEDAKKWRAMLRSGMRLMEISRKFKIPPSTINRIMEEAGV